MDTLAAKKTAAKVLEYYLRAMMHVMAAGILCFGDSVSGKAMETGYS